ncbi:YdeI/OmpD-associated family protein [Telluribacter humicola]|uniref:YdeI/OmpD-associated family protein n=1 Tax=Telluribacter humicola TaxID=1720261 RepID=UPI001A971736|nr:YdeI/OmpD-associated family protein [Telluribacter humicola]
MQNKEIETFCPTSRHDWRQWLEENHRSKQSIWLIFFKAKSGVPTLSWSEAVDEALCFGWIDSTRRSIDNEKFLQFFCWRKPKSGWSKVNKEKVQRLIEEGLMTPAGYESIATARQNGSWETLDDVEELKVPTDLTQAFEALPGSEAYFLSLSKSVRKSILHWIVLAKRPETRQNRINEVAELAGQKQKPKQFRT